MIRAFLARLFLGCQHEHRFIDRDDDTDALIYVCEDCLHTKPVIARDADEAREIRQASARAIPSQPSASDRARSVKRENVAAFNRRQQR